MNKIFKNNPQLNEYFETSDGQAFYSESAAKMHARSLDDKKVSNVVRKESETETKSNETGKEVTLPNSDQRKQLVERYTELFGKAPSANTKEATIQKRIEEKEAELKINEESDDLQEDENQNPELKEDETKD